ncbi:MAG: hypothetical protein WCH37_07115, partial [Synechococcaceae cyanobacterium ELA182]
MTRLLENADVRILNANEAGLRSFPGVRLDASAWLARLRHRAAAVVLFGAAREEIAVLLTDGGYGGQVNIGEGLAEAEELRNAAGECSRAVLLSPACASF